jgi:hypothetical protein
LLVVLVLQRFLVVVAAVLAQDAKYQHSQVMFQLSRLVVVAVAEQLLAVQAAPPLAVQVEQQQERQRQQTQQAVAAVLVTVLAQQVAQEFST